MLFSKLASKIGYNPSSFEIALFYLTKNNNLRHTYIKNINGARVRRILRKIL